MTAFLFLLVLLILPLLVIIILIILISALICGHEVSHVTASNVLPAWSPLRMLSWQGGGTCGRQLGVPTIHQTAPRLAEDDPRRPENPQNAPKTAQTALGGLQDGPKTSPGGLKMSDGPVNLLSPNDHIQTLQTATKH